MRRLQCTHGEADVRWRVYERVFDIIVDQGQKAPGDMVGDVLGRVLTFAAGIRNAHMGAGMVEICQN